MPIRIIATTIEGGTGTRLYMGGAGGAGTINLVYQDATRALTRTAINPFDPLKAAAAGVSRVAFTADNGATWGSAIFAGGSSLVRNLQWRGATDLMVTTEDELFESSDSGSSWGAITLPTITHEIADGYCRGAAGVYILEKWLDGIGGGKLHWSPNNGTTWYERDLALISGWQSDEVPRRIVTAQPDTGVNEIFILTSHSIYRGTHNNDLTTFSMTQLWDHEAAVIALFPGYPPTGFDGVDDNNTRFDDLKHIGTNVLMAGYSNLRAHSFDLSTFALTDIGAIDPAGDLASFSHHAMLSASHVIMGNSLASTELYPHRPGLNESTDGAITLYPYLLFSSVELLHHHDAFFEAEQSGCSHPSACNYKEGREYDDGSCIHAVALQDCLTGDVISTTTEAILRLRCHSPQVALSFQSLDPLEPVQEVEAWVDGTLAFTYNAAVPTTELPLVRLEMLTQGFIAWVNANTAYRAYPVAPEDNLLVPGGIGGVILEAPDGSAEGVSFELVTAGLDGTFFEDAFGLDVSGSIVTLEEYPGRCWRVCGQGSCLGAEEVTLVSTHVNCANCLSVPISSICGDCSAQVSVNGQPLIPNTTQEDPQCVLVGQSIDLTLRFSFPLSAQDPCPAEVSVVIETLDSEGTWNEETSQLYPAVSGFVEQNLVHPITSPFLRRLVITAQNCDQSKVCTYYFASCPEFSVVKVGCHDYRIQGLEDLNDPDAEVTVSIINAATEEVAIQQVIPYGSLPASLIGDEDAIYLIEISVAGGPTQTLEVIDLCDLESCLRSLVNSILCEDDHCDDPLTKKQRIDREEAQRIQSLSRQIEAALYNYRYRWTGTPDYSPQRRADLKRIAKLIQTAALLSERCADCSDKQQPKPCHDC